MQTQSGGPGFESLCALQEKNDAKRILYTHARASYAITFWTEAKASGHAMYKKKDVNILSLQVTVKHAKHIRQRTSVVFYSRMEISQKMSFS